MTQPLVRGISATAGFDAQGKLNKLTIWGLPRLEFKVDGQPDDDAEDVMGMLIWREVPTVGAKFSFRITRTTSQAGPTKHSVCYVLSINAALKEGTLFRTERIPRNPITFQGNGEWRQNGSSFGPSDVFGTHLFYLSLQQEIIHQIESLKPGGPRFRQVHLPLVDGDQVRTTSYVMERTNPIDDPMDPRFDPIEKAGIVVTLALNRQVPAQGITGSIKGTSPANQDIHMPSENDFFSAAHLSVMIHPRSPHAPICHTSLRYFETRSEKIEIPAKKSEVPDESVRSEVAPKHWAFGGALHLVPTLYDENQCQNFHNSLRDIVEPHGKEFYSSAKKWCDDYFYDPINQEALGVGGIFFDRLGPGSNKRFDLDNDVKRPRTQEDCRNFVRDITVNWSNVFMQGLQGFAWQPWTAGERHFQLRRRAGLIEHFFLTDMGFRFGLMTKSGSLAAMRLVLPETVQWTHDEDVKVLPPKASKLLEVVRGAPLDWAYAQQGSE